MREYRYILKPYRTKADRTTCPHCGHKGEFALYIDTITGKPLDDSVGRCNREKSCGYHYTPAEFFADKPDKKIDEDSGVKQAKPICIDTERRVEYLPQKFMPTSSRLEESNFFKFFVSQFGEDDARKVFQDYHVGASKHWRNDGGIATAFPQITENGKLAQIKVMAYHPTTGKRLHKEHSAERLSKSGYFHDEGQADKVWFAGKTLLNNQEANLRQCFFGQHLLPRFNDVSIVESEKTAMIASLFFKDVCWLATGGKNGCRWTAKDVASVLVGKKVTLYPDLGCFDAWAANAEKLKSYGITVTVSRYLDKIASDEDKERGLDIGDFLLRQNRGPVPKDYGSDDTTIQDEQNKPTERKSMNYGEFFAYAKEIGLNVEFDTNTKSIYVHN